MPSVFAIDPGPEQSAYALLQNGNHVADAGKKVNDDILRMMHEVWLDVPLVVERVQSFGMPVGASVFRTCEWFGRFKQQWLACGNKAFHSMTRKEVVTRLCGTSRAKDANVKQVVIDRLGEPGTKKNPGRTYIVRQKGGADIWQALGLALAWWEQYREAVDGKT